MAPDPTIRRSAQTLGAEESKVILNQHKIGEEEFSEEDENEEEEDEDDDDEEEEDEDEEDEADEEEGELICLKLFFLEVVAIITFV